MGSWEFDIKENKFFWSEGMYRIFELTDTNVVPGIYADVAIEEDQAVARRIVSAIQHEPIDFTEIVHIKANRKIKTLKVKGTVMRNEFGMPVKVLGIDFDISVLSQSEAVLKERSQLRELDRAKTKFFSSPDCHLTGVEDITVDDELNVICNF